ncbi:M23 family metallopeptidase [Marinococcus halotolerans]|uniref:M23 family metallopeptidase n=1 Tax=Marinococcus halotolerans TaxID=301092 RepID=UPI0003B79F4D|nr:M23 family metallopeptidase [Marinococcus halotolerans]
MTSTFPDHPITPQEFGNLFLRGEFVRIYEQTTNDFKGLAASDEFQEMAAGFNKGVTAYNLLFSYQIDEHLVQYVWNDDRNERALEVYMDHQHFIHGLVMQPVAIDPVDEKEESRKQYRWPVQPGMGWTIVWGGNHPLANAHHHLSNQRYAYDLVIQTEGKTYEKSPACNEHYTAYEQPIYAPAEGTIAEVIDGIPDNEPGVMNEEELAGNVVVIHHASEEYSVLAHLQPGSILVRKGERVSMGQVIGKCGNSGNSSEPHLHMQLSTQADFLYGKSISMKFANGCHPIRGDQINE